jgi:hypothetical protein
MNTISWTFLDVALGMFYIGLFLCGWRAVLSALGPNQLRDKPAPRPAAAQLGSLATALTLADPRFGSAFPDLRKLEGHACDRNVPLEPHPDHDQIPVLAAKTG